MANGTKIQKKVEHVSEITLATAQKEVSIFGLGATESYKTYKNDETPIDSKFGSIIALYGEFRSPTGGRMVWTDALADAATDFIDKLKITPWVNDEEWLERIGGGNVIPRPLDLVETVYDDGTNKAYFRYVQPYQNGALSQTGQKMGSYNPLAIELNNDNFRYDLVFPAVPAELNGYKIRFRLLHWEYPVNNGKPVMNQ